MALGHLHDVVIVGSGAAGGSAAYELTRLGVNCVLLEAGPVIEFDRHVSMRRVCDLPFRGFGKPRASMWGPPSSEFDDAAYATEAELNYTHNPANPYCWVGIRALGGRTLTWSGHVWRMSDLDFRAREHDGCGANWPIVYTDVAPFYDSVERLFQIVGRREGLSQVPDGVFQEDMTPEPDSTRRFAESARGLGIHTTSMRRPRQRFAASSSILLRPALETGKLTLVPNAIVREVTWGEDRRLATGVAFVDRRTRLDYVLRARVVVLAASCLESTRILMFSNLPDASGVLGRYLFDHFYLKDVISCIVPDARGSERHISQGVLGYVPRFRNLVDRRHDFVRGYAFEFGSQGTPAASLLPGYGHPLIAALREKEGRAFHMMAIGEVLPSRSNYVRLNQDVRDEWGIPMLEIEQQYGENERRMSRDAVTMAEEMCRRAGFEVLAHSSATSIPGESAHELGTCRMGDDPHTSVLNPFNQAHQVPNLFVLDGSAFVSGGCQNPTLTIAALALRASRHIASRMRRGDL